MIMESMAEFEEEWCRRFNGTRENDCLEGYYIQRKTKEKISVRLDLKKYNKLVQLSAEVKKLRQNNFEGYKDRIQSLVDSWNEEWNEKWNSNHLDGADLSGAVLYNLKLSDCSFKVTNFNDAKIEWSKFERVDLDDSSFCKAKIKLSTFADSSFNRSDLRGAKIAGSDFTTCICEGMRVDGAEFENSNLTNMLYTPSPYDDYSKILFEQSNIKVAQFPDAVLSFINYNRKKKLWNDWFAKEIRRYTSSSTFEFESYVNKTPIISYIMPEKLEKSIWGYLVLPIFSIIFYLCIFLLEIIICAMYCAKNNGIYGAIKGCINGAISGATRVFWYSTNYGYSTFRIVATFISLTLLFTLIYFIGGDAIINLEPTTVVSGETVTVHLDNWYKLLRCLYFSIVTMTTLGFGDITATADRTPGYIIISVHVILGYIILGALITRFGTLFSSNGPTITLEDYKRMHPNKRAESEQGDDGLAEAEE